jgi:hypothetical protein
MALLYLLPYSAGLGELDRVGKSVICGFVGRQGLEP